METYNLLSFRGYPMYQKIKREMKGMDKSNNTTFGDSFVDVVVLTELQQGDKLIFGNETHIVDAVEEQRVPRGNHTSDAIFQRVKCSFVNQLPAEA